MENMDTDVRVYRVHSQILPAVISLFFLFPVAVYQGLVAVG